MWFCRVVLIEETVLKIFFVFFKNLFYEIYVVDMGFDNIFEDDEERGELYDDVDYFFLISSLLGSS